MSNTVVRPLVPEDYPAVKEIVTESFGADLPEDVRQPFFQALKRYEEEPWYDPEHLLVAEVDGEVVSQMGVRTGRLSLGGAASVPAALVGTVCTRASHRGQGIGSEMMRSAFGWMARFGPAVSYLHTSTERHGFYGRLGYRKAIMSCPRLMVDPHRMGLSAASPPVRDATAADRELIGSIYTAHYGHLSGAWSRTDRFWENRLARLQKLWSRPVDFRLCEVESPAAYIGVMERDGGAVVAELACFPGAEAEALALLRATLARWRADSVAVIELDVASCDPLRPRLAELWAEDRTAYGVVLVRVQDVDLFLKAISPCLQRRATTVGRCLRLRLDSGHSLAVGTGDDLNLQLNSGDLLSLLYNGRRLPGLIEAGEIRVGDEGLLVLQGLFPDTGAARRSLDSY